MKIYPNTWIPPKGPVLHGIDQKFVVAAERHDVATEAVQRLERYIALPVKPRGPDLVPAMRAWVEVLSDQEDPRYGVLIWYILNSSRNSGADMWVWVLNYANGRFKP